MSDETSFATGLISGFVFTMIAVMLFSAIENPNTKLKKQFCAITCAAEFGKDRFARSEYESGVCECIMQILTEKKQ